MLFQLLRENRYINWEPLSWRNLTIITRYVLGRYVQNEHWTHQLNSTVSDDYINLKRCLNVACLDLNPRTNLLPQSEKLNALERDSPAVLAIKGLAAVVHWNESEESSHSGDKACYANRSFKIMSIHRRKSKIGISVTPQKGLMSSKELARRHFRRMLTIPFRDGGTGMGMARSKLTGLNMSAGSMYNGIPVR